MAVTRGHWHTLGTHCVEDDDDVVRKGWMVTHMCWSGHRACGGKTWGMGGRCESYDGGAEHAQVEWGGG